MGYKNKADKQKYERQYYRNNPNYFSERNKKSREFKRQFIVDYKSTRWCVKCGENHPATLDFHHVNDDKEGGVSYAASNQWPISRIEAEMKKCIILCSNCHRKHHWEIKNIKKLDVKKRELMA